MPETATSGASASTSASTPSISLGRTAGNGPLHGPADAAVDAACRAVARGVWSSSHEYLDPWVAQEIRKAAGAFVLARQEQPPERVLASLKHAFHEALLRHGDARNQEAVRGLLLAAFLGAYYGAGPRR